MKIYYFNSKESTHTKEQEAAKSSSKVSDSELQVSSNLCENKSISENKQRGLQRIDTASNDGYFIDDRSEININFQKYRMVFVVNKDAVFYKKSALRQARKVNIIQNNISLYHT